MEHMYKIYDFSNESAWLKGRMNGIGGSDASAVVGLNPYKSNIDLFEEKIGRRILEDISNKPWVVYGKLAEAPIRELFKLDYPEYQVDHHEFRILQSNRYPFMQASLDGELTNSDGCRGILEMPEKRALRWQKQRSAQLQKYYDEKLTERTISEFERQAGILGKTIQDNAKAANSIVNASFHNATFSDRIWMYQDMLKNELNSLLQTGLIQGQNPRKLATHLRKRFGVSQVNAERLLITEMAKVQTEAQKQSFERNGFEEYTFLALGTACPICRALDEKHFKVAKMMPGTNAPPMHPNCRCSVAAYEDSEEYEEWLNFLNEGGTTEEWNGLKKAGKSVAKASGSGILKLPRYKDAVIPKAKFTQYALNPDKDLDKAMAFEKALGYTEDNVDELISQIYDKISEYDAKEKPDKGWGKRYELIIDMTGPNGKTAKVLTAWINDKNTGEMRLTSAYVDKE